jgi:uncharacterized repeat protein (TIGR01451 family)
MSVKAGLCTTGSHGRKHSIVGVISVFLLLSMGGLTAAHAALENTAIASGTYGGGTITSDPDSVSVPVAPATPALKLSKTAGTITTQLGGSSVVDGGDTVTYNYVIENTGNVTLSNVTPVDTGPTFVGNAGTGTMGSFTLTGGTLPLAPNATVTYTATYTLSALDVYRAAGVANAVSNTAIASATAPSGATVDSLQATADTTIPAGALLTLTKTAALNDTYGIVAGEAEAGESIAYTYTVANSGNVALTNVNINDNHEGAVLPANSFTGEALISEGPLGTPASSDASINGIWDLLQPGATITLTYIHTVTQEEIDNQ